MHSLAIMVAMCGTSVASAGSFGWVAGTLLAQGAVQDEEEALEADMVAARRRLGHQDNNGSAQELGGVGDREEAGPRTRPRWRAQDERVEGEGPEHVRGPRRHRATQHAHELGPDTSGHAGFGASYYLMWGIVDWSSAGLVWGGALFSGALASGLWMVANQSVQLSDAQRYPPGTDNEGPGVRKRDYRQWAVALTGFAVGLAGGGGVLAWRGAHNLGIYSDLRDQQRAPATPFRQRYDRETRRDE